VIIGFSGENQRGDSGEARFLFSEERAPPISHLEQPSCFRLVINKKALETLSLTIPPAIVMRADEVVN